VAGQAVNEPTGARTAAGQPGVFLHRSAGSRPRASDAGLFPASGATWSCWASRSSTPRYAFAGPRAEDRVAGNPAEDPAMKLLFLSSLCSTPLLPNLSPGNARILRALRAIADCRVISRSSRPGRRCGGRDSGGGGGAGRVAHLSPTHLPHPGGCTILNGVFYTLSVAPMVHAEVARFRLT